MFAIHGLHGPEDEAVTWEDGGGDQLRKQKQAKKKDKEKEVAKQDSVFDITSFGKPMPAFLRHRFRLDYILAYFKSLVNNQAFP